MQAKDLRPTTGDLFDQIGHAPCSACDSDRITTALSSPNLRSDLGNSTKAAGLIEAEYKIKHYKALLRLAAGNLEEAVRSAKDASARVTSAEGCAAEAIVKVAAAEAAHSQSETSRLQTERELERHRGLLEETELELRRAQRSINRLEAENQMLKRSLEKVKDSKEHYAHAFRDLQAQQDEKETRRVLDIQRNFIEGREEGWNDGRWYGYEEGFKKGRKEGYREGKEEGKRAEREKALAAFDRFLEGEMDAGRDTRSERTRQWAESVHKQ